MFILFWGTIDISIGPQWVPLFLSSNNSKHTILMVSLPYVLALRGSQIRLHRTSHYHHNSDGDIYSDGDGDNDDNNDDGDYGGGGDVVT